MPPAAVRARLGWTLGWPLTLPSQVLEEVPAFEVGAVAAVAAAAEEEEEEVVVALLSAAASGLCREGCCVPS